MNPEEFDEKFLFKQTYQYGENDKPIDYFEYLSKNTLIHIWPSSKLFLDLIDHNPKIIENKTIFDVGCGTGLTGIVRFLYNMK
jgi:16S rRNA G527 N7-methylase RsmG